MNSKPGFGMEGYPPGLRNFAKAMPSLALFTFFVFLFPVVLFNVKNHP